MNKKPLGGHADVQKLVEYLGRKQKGWPVPLVNPVEVTSSVNAAANTSLQPSVRAASPSESNVDDDIDSMKVWLHPKAQVRAIVHYII